MKRTRRVTDDNLARALAFLRSYRAVHGYAPSVRELQVALELPSAGTAHTILRRLEQDGLIRRRAGLPRALVLSDDQT